MYHTCKVRFIGNGQCYKPESLLQLQWMLRWPLDMPSQWVPSQRMCTTVGDPNVTTSVLWNRQKLERAKPENAHWMLRVMHEGDWYVWLVFWFAGTASCSGIKKVHGCQSSWGCREFLVPQYWYWGYVKYRVRSTADTSKIYYHSHLWYWNGCTKWKLWYVPNIQRHRSVVL